MKMKHTVRFNNGNQEVFEFSTKADSDKAFENAIQLNKTFKSILCIWIEPVSQPWKRKRIDF